MGRVEDETAGKGRGRHGREGGFSPFLLPLQPSEVGPQVSGSINVLPRFTRQMATPITLVMKGSLQVVVGTPRMKVEIPLNLSLALKPGEERILARRGFQFPLLAQDSPPNRWTVQVILQVGELSSPSLSVQ